MVKVACSAGESVKLGQLAPFQGSLKKREQSDIEELKESVLREGLLMPFAVWKDGGKLWLLDGHGRLEALLQLAVDDPSLLEASFPAIVVEAASEEDARKALLQITSSYGKVTRKGVAEFTAKVPGYVAPVVKKFLPKPVPSEGKFVGTKIIRIAVPADRASDVREVLSSISYIEVL